ncbi:YggU family protein [Methanoculleus sp. FWC-SCC1]|uniref:UPF0235 protein FGU65_01045 n=1 Tax=Methanoculleus frigidifontis TaxID=2584085 RepID=A0ABT8M6D7_9EURY|nr:DUF167 domain-containing protein [Methanoculleus sp. FWC-SCC1]MDN7023499.1 YggU family protein [Methanoculleus sp. FWC-SCC1]
MTSFADAVTETDTGVRIALDVSAGAKKTVFPAGYNEWRRSIRCQIAAPAVGGRANKEIVRVVADTIGIPQSSVAIASGATSSQKSIQIIGKARADVLAVLKPLLGT